jgi:acetylornithine deacetylase
MKAANQLGLKPKALVVGEPTELKLVRSQKGILKARLVSHGVACHSGYPALGKSAIDPLIDVLHELLHAEWPKSEELGDTTLNVGLVQGGQVRGTGTACLMKTMLMLPWRIFSTRVAAISSECMCCRGLWQAANALAAYAEATLMFRVISPPEEILQRVTDIVGDRLAVEPITMNPPVLLGTLEGYTPAIVAFNTDIPYFTLGEGSTPYLIGPGSILEAHSAHEFIKIEELSRAIEVYHDLAHRLLE